MRRFFAVLPLLVALLCCSKNKQAIPEPVLVKKIQIPQALRIESKSRGVRYRYGGDLRIGNLDGDGIVDFLIFRSAENGMKPCFLGAFDREARVLWSVGEGGTQPRRPGPVSIYDLNGDGTDEILALFADATKTAVKGGMENVLIQVRNGSTGQILRERTPQDFLHLQGLTPDWLHQRILITNLRGQQRAQDFVMKLGNHIFAFDDALTLLWHHEIPFNQYGEGSAYIPAVGDMDEDGKDEVTGGLFLLAPDGRVLWEKFLSPNMDSVAITEWDNGKKRVIGSGSGHVVSISGKVILALGTQAVPHGQEVRVADFLPESPGPEMILRHKGHQPDVILVSNEGKILRDFRLNESPNNTGMEVVYWNGINKPPLLYNGGQLWAADGSSSIALPGLAQPPSGPAKTGWYRCIPADVYGDESEEMIVFNPWEDAIYIYARQQTSSAAFKPYRPGPRQYNARLMD